MTENLCVRVIRGAAALPTRSEAVVLLAAAALMVFAGASATGEVSWSNGVISKGLHPVSLAADNEAFVEGAPVEDEAAQLTPDASAEDPENPEAAWYYPLPITGEIGLETKAKTLALALEDARQQSPDYVVLCIDSVGGSVDETRKILEVIAEAQDLKLVAYVERALSAAAVIALACPDIYMKPSAVIGGAVSYQGSAGTPKTIDAETESVIRAQFRAAVEMGGHPSVIVEAMMDPQMQLLLVEADGKKTLAAEGQGKLIKAKGKVLALTAKEGMECGLVKGAAGNMESMNVAMGITIWNRMDAKGWDLMMGQAIRARREVEQEQERRERAAQIKEDPPQLKQIDAKIAKTQGELRLVNVEMSLLKGQYDREIAAIHAEYARARRRAAALGAAGRIKERERLLLSGREKRDSKLNSLRQKFEPKVMSLKLKIQRINESLVLLATERRQVLSEK